MRYFKLLVMGGIVLALSSPTWAIPTSIPFETAYAGPVSWHFSNWDEGVVYGPTAAAVDGVAYPVGDAAHVSVLQPIKEPVGANTDGWGIIRVDTIYNAAHTGPNSMTIGSTQLYNNGDSGTELVGVFYGKKDDTVTFNADGSQTIYSDPLGYFGERVDLYLQPAGTLANWIAGAAGPGASGALGVYPGIGGPGGVAGATLVLTGFVTPGFENGGLDGAFSAFTPEGATGEGSFGEYITWDGGTDLSMFHSVPGIFPFLGGPGAPFTADARLKGTDVPTIDPLNDPWLISTSDPAYMDVVVPEPVTVAGMLLGIGCLGRYLRKRS